MKIYFSDFFNCSPDVLEKYEALDISLIADLPLFVDPFLLFNSDKPEYQKLHEQMIEYIKFLKSKADSGDLATPLIDSWYMFREVKQNWLGYTLNGNSGRGLGAVFANSLHDNLHNVFRDFGTERITKGRHIEKLCLIKGGVGRDNISDFTTNLIKKYLLEYTQEFTKAYISPGLTKVVAVPRVQFSYKTETWQPGTYLLPWFVSDYVILTPEDMLTKDDTWISQRDLFRRYDHIVDSVPNAQLRMQLHNYFESVLPKKKKNEEFTKEEEAGAVLKVLERFPELIDYYILDREEHGDDAVKTSSKKVEKVKGLFIEQVRQFVAELQKRGFYDIGLDSYAAAMKRVLFLKHEIEHNDGYRIFYLDGEPVEREEDLKRMYRLTWYASLFEVDTEVNNGRGPVDAKVSKGSLDKSLVEFKLAKNSKLAQNLANQVDVYKKANKTDKAIKVILYFTYAEFEKVKRILKELRLENDDSIVLIDARNDNKVSASKVKTAERSN